VILAVSLLSTYDRVVGQFSPQWPTIGKYVPNLSLSTWLAIILFVIIIVTLEGTYQYNRKTITDLEIREKARYQGLKQYTDTLTQQITTLTEERLELRYVEQSAHYREKTGNQYVFRIGVRTTANKTAKKVEVLSSLEPIKLYTVQYYDSPSSLRPLVPMNEQTGYHVDVHPSRDYLTYFNVFKCDTKSRILEICFYQQPLQIKIGNSIRFSLNITARGENIQATYYFGDIAVSKNKAPTFLLGKVTEI
jgi:hypothetical protein